MPNKWWRNLVFSLGGNRSNSSNGKKAMCWCEVAMRWSQKLLLPMSITHKQKHIHTSTHTYSSQCFDSSSFLEFFKRFNYTKAKWKRRKKRKQYEEPLSPHVFDATFHSIWSVSQSNRSASKFSTLQEWNDEEGKKKEKRKPQPVRHVTHKKVKCMEFQLNCTKL